jgi:hypothetical protein
MTWKADTLSYPESFQTWMSNILAFNSKDIFIYGHNYTTRGKVYHYDGVKWEVFPLVDYIGGYNLWKMISFSRNNIWGVGNRGSVEGLIFNYDGRTWAEKKVYANFNPPKYSYNPPLFSIDGESAGELYIGGMDGVIWYCKNGKWMLDTVKIKVPPNTEYKLHSLAIYKDHVLILGGALNPMVNFEKHYLIKGNIKNWVVLDSMDFTNPNLIQTWGMGELIKGNNGKMYSRGPRGLYVWDGTAWSKFYQHYYQWGFYVYSDNYMLTLGKGGSEYFNGASWVDLGLTIFKNYSDVTFRAAWTDGKELFLVGNTFDSNPQKTIVLHGK